MREIFNDLLGLGIRRVDSDIFESIKKVGLTNQRDFVPCSCKNNLFTDEVVGFPVTLLLKPQTKRKVI